MSLPVTALCLAGSTGQLYAISGSTIYRGATPVAALNHDGIKSAVSCASFWSPYLVVCAGRVISIYKCTDDNLSFDHLVSCPSVALSVLPSNKLWLISFITGDWGCLDVSTGTLSYHKGKHRYLLFLSVSWISISQEGSSRSGLCSASGRALSHWCGANDVWVHSNNLYTLISCPLPYISSCVKF